MIYRLTVNDAMITAMDRAGKEKVRRILCDGLGLEYEEVKRGRPRKAAPIIEKAPSKELEPNILKESIIKVIVPELPKESTISKEERIRLGVEKIAREKAERQALQKAKQSVNHDPPVEDDELPPPEL